MMILSIKFLSQYILVSRCDYKKLEKRVKDEGNKLGVTSPYSEAECQVICDNTLNCQSFGYDPNKHECWFYDRRLYGSEEQKGCQFCFPSCTCMYTVYKDECGKCDKERNRFLLNYIEII